MSHGVFWACDQCGGRAIGLELLRRTFTPESINPLWLHAISGEGKIGPRCPSCRRPMIDVALSENTAVNVDVCRSCHFVWFDTHEVETLVPRPLPQTAPELPQKARELLAVAKVQELAEEARGTDFDSSPPDEFWKSIAAFCGLPIESDTLEQTRRPIGDVDALPGDHLCERIRVYAAAPGRAAFRIDPGRSNAFGRPHISRFIFPSCRNHSSHRQHLFPFRVR